MLQDLLQKYLQYFEKLLEKNRYIEIMYSLSYYLFYVLVLFVLHIIRNMKFRDQCDKDN